MLSDVRLHAIEVLRALRRVYKYRELEEITGLPAPALWRYVNMKILPTEDRAKELINKLTSGDVIKRIFRKYVSLVDDYVVSTINLIYNIDMLRIFSLIAYREFHSLGPTAVATVEVDGIPLAVKISDILDAKLVIAKRRPDVGVSNYYEVSYMSRDPPTIVHLYIPSETLDGDDRVLIVDDLLRSGKTSQALIRLIRKTGATPVGLYALIALGTNWYETLKNEVDKIYVVYTLQ